MLEITLLGVGIRSGPALEGFLIIKKEVRNYILISQLFHNADETIPTNYWITLCKNKKIKNSSVGTTTSSLWDRMVVYSS
jgi:hypothetical protein